MNCRWLVCCAHGAVPPRLGLAIDGLAFAPWGLIALFPLLASILWVTGIPPTETQAIRSKGDAYRDYQKRVSRFIPLPPKSHGSDPTRIS